MSVGQFGNRKVAILDPANIEEIIPGDPSSDIQAIRPLQLLDIQGKRIPIEVDISAIGRKKFYAIIREDFQVALDFELLSPTVQALLGELSYTVTYRLDPGGVLGEVTKQTFRGETRYNSTRPQGGETTLRVALRNLCYSHCRIDGVVKFNYARPDQDSNEYSMIAWAEGPYIVIE
jgi:hypothetical protein